MKVTRWESGNKPIIEDLRCSLKKEGLEPSLWRDSPGTYYGNHTHPYQEVRWIVDGMIMFGVGGEEIILNTGDRLDLPEETLHWAQVIGDCPVVYLSASKMK
jgi:quercetin dioxygenase-like cupin family protein